ncbi:hypothetical protein LY76DRAFT_305414 [Colletotrichum caudatum]|nr:hypothetical protein LY76DRAFT_305414 [Colletotrichum caudatum]
MCVCVCVCVCVRVRVRTTATQKREGGASRTTSLRLGYDHHAVPIGGPFAISGVPLSSSSSPSPSLNLLRGVSKACAAPSSSPRKQALSLSYGSWGLQKLKRRRGPKTNRPSVAAARESRAPSEARGEATAKRKGVADQWPLEARPGGAASAARPV